MRAVRLLALAAVVTVAGAAGIAPARSASALAPDPVADTNCPIDGLAGLLCGLLTVPFPLPPPTDARSTPAPAPPPPPAPAPPSPLPPVASVAPDAGPPPAVDDPFLLRLLDLLSHRPDMRPRLLHFRPAGAPAAATGAAPAFVGGCPSVPASCLASGIPLQLPAGGLLLLVCAAVLLTGDLRSLGWRRGWRPLLALAGAGIAAAAVVLLPERRSPAPAGGSLGAAVAAVARELWVAPAATTAPAPAPGPWERLLELERRISAPGDEEPALAGEYDLYRAAALDPATRATLVTAATGSGVPGAAAAVTDNLEVIAASLAEEAVVADAQARLAQYGGLQSAQLQAIQDHQPLMVPLLADVTQWFGVSDLWMEPPMRYRGVLYPHFHTGIDLAAPFDTPIHAAADGMVLSAGTTTNGSGRPVGYGTYVVIAHSTEVITLYGHLDRLAVAAGDQVHQGQIIGLEGSTGMSTGPHLHFELRAGGVPVDPWPFIRNQLPESP